jgi:hypothetical protein
MMMNNEQNKNRNSIGRNSGTNPGNSWFSFSTNSSKPNIRWSNTQFSSIQRWVLWLDGKMLRIWRQPTQRQPEHSSTSTTNHKFSSRTQPKRLWIWTLLGKIVKNYILTQNFTFYKSVIQTHNSTDLCSLGKYPSAGSVDG